MLKKFGIGDYKSTKWSGGITTELYIYPENSSYKDRNVSVSRLLAIFDTNKFQFQSKYGNN